MQGQRRTTSGFGRFGQSLWSFRHFYFLPSPLNSNSRSFPLPSLSLPLTFPQSLLLGRCLKLCCSGQTLVPKESHLGLQPPALHFGDRRAQHLFWWASSCKPLEHLS